MMNEALKWMTKSKKFIYDVREVKSSMVIVIFNL